MTKTGTDEWLDERRRGVTSTDIPAILGVSPWRSEGDVGREKLGLPVERQFDDATERRLRIGSALEAVIRAEDEIEHGIKLRRVRRFIVDPKRSILRTSLDFERVGERTIVEAKSSKSRDWDDGLPDYVEAQVRWQMGVARYPRAHVAALRFGSELACFDIDHDEPTFEQLVTIAYDFWDRVQQGGPFNESRASVARAFPLDDGLTMVADAELDEAVKELLAARANLAALTELEERLVAAIETRMGPTSALLGDGYKVTWKRTKDAETTDWKGVANDALGLLDSVTIEQLISRYTTVRAGHRRFVVREETR